MKTFNDWKFFLTLVITVASVAIPIWLWQADLNSKSLSIKLITHVSIQPKEQDSLSGIEISVDGSLLENPHLVVIEVSNNGSKPISSTDYESPLDIYLESKTSFVRSSITSKNPTAIEATILSKLEKITLNPTLLNPKDSITITAITSGEPPIIGSKARVIGISNISLEDSTIEKTNTLTLAFLLTGSLLCLVVVSLMADSLFQPEDISLRRRAAIIVGLTSLFPGMIALIIFLERIGAQEFWLYMLYAMALVILASFIAGILNRKTTAPQEEDDRNQ